MALYQIKFFRRLILPMLKFLNPGRIKIKHHYTQADFFLDFFKHKGYWYHGVHREQDSMNLFKTIIRPNDTVIEVGGHIGYLTSYFALLVPQGIVYVLEPGTNNLPYLRQNINGLKNVTLFEKAISDKNGSAKFYIENLTGQNNSLVSDYEFYNVNKKNAFVESTKEEVSVETITLDSFCDEFSIIPNFIKIDIEGAEILALKGMFGVLKKFSPIVMVEITQNWELIYDMFEMHGYNLFDEKLKPLTRGHHHFGNTFCFNLTKHSLPYR